MTTASEGFKRFSRIISAPPVTGTGALPTYDSPGAKEPLLVKGTGSEAEDAGGDQLARSASPADSIPRRRVTEHQAPEQIRRSMFNSLSYWLIVLSVA